jgi:Tol biopolymer transport system component
LYTLSVPDWKAAKRYTDIYLVSLERGVESARQMTFTKEKNETAPQWSRDGKLFVFASDREAPTASPTQNQLYLMRPDGGEARKLTEAKDGVGTFAFSKDGKWLAFSSGKENEQQVWTLPVAEIETAKAGAGDQTLDARHLVAVCARQQAALLHRAGHFRQRQQGARREEVHRAYSQ